MTPESTALAYQILMLDMRIKTAVQHHELHEVEVLLQQREDAADERYRALRLGWIPPLRAMRASKAVA